ncbi:hypothetical protein [Acinetobacter sp. GXMZU3951]
MKGIYQFLLLFIVTLSYQLAKADLVELSHESSTDRISQLTETLAQGSFVEAADIDITDSTEASKKKPILINPQDYKDLGINNLDKIYIDSDIWYLPESNEYVEQKYFPNNIRFFKFLNQKFALLEDANDESASDNDHWYINCTKDRITDEKVCILGKYEMAFIRSSKTGWIFSVSKETKKLDLRAYQYIRIDKLPALKSKTFFKGQPTLNIIEQMKKGHTAYTRFYEWSDDYEEIIPLKGFSIAYNTLNIMYSKF